ncbi:MAG: hypothetical protein ACL93V_06185 [Candidatus Electrothrix sp. YB6]
MPFPVYLLGIYGEDQSMVMSTDKDFECRVEQKTRRRLAENDSSLR